MEFRAKIILIVSIVLSSCSGKTQVDNVSKTTNIASSDSLLRTHVVGREFTRSQIINPNFEKDLIFGVWGTSLDAPACDFEIDEKRFLLCDYDGDGERMYLIIGDSIFLDNPTLIFKGKILKVNIDSLTIHWQETKSPEVLLRWKSEN